MGHCRGGKLKVKGGRGRGGKFCRGLFVVPRGAAFRGAPRTKKGKSQRDASMGKTKRSGAAIFFIKLKKKISHEPGVSHFVLLFDNMHRVLSVSVVYVKCMEELECV